VFVYVTILIFTNLHVFLFISIWNFRIRLSYAKQFTILKLALCLAYA